MSRRRGEFAHRTSIFEGAFRAWSHLGGLEPQDLDMKTFKDLDPLVYQIKNDFREAFDNGNDANNEEEEGDERPIIVGDGTTNTTIIHTRKNADGSKRKLFPYEPLSRSGLAHPFVQAILSPWLGSNAEYDAIQLGLTTLRTWWQHRRKGESDTAISVLGTEKMRKVVDGYTTHFFNLAYSLVIIEKEQPPRTLHNKIKSEQSKSTGPIQRRGGGNGTIILPGGIINNASIPTATAKQQQPKGGLGNKSSAKTNNKTFNNKAEKKIAAKAQHELLDHDQQFFSQQQNVGDDVRLITEEGRRMSQKASEIVAGITNNISTMNPSIINNILNVPVVNLHNQRPFSTKLVNANTAKIMMEKNSSTTMEKRTKINSSKPSLSSRVSASLKPQKTHLNKENNVYNTDLVADKFSHKMMEDHHKSLMVLKKSSSNKKSTANKKIIKKKYSPSKYKDDRVMSMKSAAAYVASSLKLDDEKESHNEKDWSEPTTIPSSHDTTKPNVRYPILGREWDKIEPSSPPPLELQSTTTIRANYSHNADNEPTLLPPKSDVIRKIHQEEKVPPSFELSQQLLSQQQDKVTNNSLFTMRENGRKGIINGNKSSSSMVPTSIGRNTNSNKRKLSATIQQHDTETNNNEFIADNYGGDSKNYPNSLNNTVSGSISKKQKTATEAKELLENLMESVMLMVNQFTRYQEDTQNYLQQIEEQSIKDNKIIALQSLQQILHRRLIQAETVHAESYKEMNVTEEEEFFLSDNANKEKFQALIQEKRQRVHALENIITKINHDIEMNQQQMKVITMSDSNCATTVATTTTMTTATAEDKNDTPPFRKTTTTVVPLKKIW